MPIKHFSPVANFGNQSKRSGIVITFSENSSILPNLQKSKQNYCPLLFSENNIISQNLQEIEQIISL